MTNVNYCIEHALADFTSKGYSLTQLRAVGVTNQRETTIMWDKETGKPFHNAIVWHDTRTEPLVKAMVEKVGGRTALLDKTGLPLATYFCASKLQWILENVPEAASAMSAGRAMFGTVDCYLLWRLTGRHITDITNASRTLLFNINTLTWDTSLCELWGIDPRVLPEVVGNAEVYGPVTMEKCPLKGLVPVAGCMGDQQAALFGHACFTKGQMKCTYGTGCFLLQHAGNTPPTIDPASGMLATVAYRIRGDTCYAIEGSVAVAGSCMQWLRDEMGFFKSASEIEPLARSVESSEGVALVPAFSGLFAPRWRSDARACIVGMTHRTNRAHIVRAALEAVAHQVVDVVDAMGGATTLAVDGGMTVNGLLMDIQAGLLGCPVEVAQMAEVTALGAALAAGLAVGCYIDEADIKARSIKASTVQSGYTDKQRAAAKAQWEKAIARSLDWAE